MRNCTSYVWILYSGWMEMEIDAMYVHVNDVHDGDRKRRIRVRCDEGRREDGQYEKRSGMTQYRTRPTRLCVASIS